MAAKGSHIMEAKSHRNQFGRPSGPGDDDRDWPHRQWYG